MGTAYCALRDLNVWGTVAGKTVRLWDRKSLGTTCSYLTPLAACQALFPSVSTSSLHTPNPFPPHHRQQAGPCTPGFLQRPSHSWDLEASPLSGPWGGRLAEPGAAPPRPAMPPPPPPAGAARERRSPPRRGGRCHSDAGGGGDGRRHRGSPGPPR